MDDSFIHQPSYIEDPGRIIVIGDIHGDIDRLMHIFTSLQLFSQNLEWIAEPQNTVVVQLGDQIDSIDRSGINKMWDYDSSICIDGILDLNVLTLMDKLDGIASANGGRILSLIGNHELMNIMHNFEFVSECSLNIVNAETRKELFTRGTGKYTQLLAKRNIIVKVGKFIFCHGGLLPEHVNLIDMMCKSNTSPNYDILNIIFRKFILNISLNDTETILFKAIIINDNGILWTRYYMNLLATITINPVADYIFDYVLNQVLTNMEAISMFIGHNTVDKITGVSNNKLFFVDAGLSRAYNTPQIQVIDIKKSVNEEGVTSAFCDVVNLIEIPC